MSEPLRSPTPVEETPADSCARPQSGPARKGISVEGQMRIVVGTLIVIGSALGAFVHPGFLGITAFIGCGLVFAGLTDRCGMTVLLGWMPWNRAARGPSGRTV